MAMWFGKNDGSERILVPHQSQLDLTTAMSLCAWINMKTVTTGAGNYAEYISKNDFYFIQYSVNSGGSEIGFQYTGSYRGINDGIVPTANVWFHLVGTYDSAAAGNNFIIYRDGVLANSARYTDTVLTTATGLSIASLNSSRYFKGILADCRVYNRALSANEIKTIYASQGHDGIHYGLVGRWILDEGFDTQLAISGSSLATDSSDYKNNGTVYAD